MRTWLKFQIRPFFLGLLIIMVLGANSVDSVNAVDPPPDAPFVDSVLLSRAKNGDPLDFMIYFTEQADLSAAYSMGWEERGDFVYERLNRQAEESQARVRKFLDARGESYTPFWISNTILVESTNSSTLNGLLNFTEIETLQSVAEVMLMVPDRVPDEAFSTETRGVSPNLQRINADDVWKIGYTGTGMVVGSIDTGVRYTHDSLEDQYRGNQGGSFNHAYDWWDAVNRRGTPYDDHSHGTHTTGIMVGDDGGSNRIGVAPGAKWIACKGLAGDGSGNGNHLLACAQFMLAPTDLSGSNANPDWRPHVINNSWGDCEKTYNNWFEDAIDAWHAAGIYPVFAQGNAGNCSYGTPPGLDTVGNPARSYHVTAVGSTGNNNGAYATHSNWGPTDDRDRINPLGFPWIKPQVVAPGVSVLSAVSGGDTQYALWTGTSMSAPHVAGLVALLWQASPGLRGDYAATETLIQNTADAIPYATGHGDEGPGNVPNHATGWGEIDALAAVLVNRVEFTDSVFLPIIIH